MSAIRQVSVENFAPEVTQSAVPVLVDFYTEWCRPCRLLAPVLDGLAREYAGRIKIVKVNVDEEPELTSHFRVQSIPTLLAFRDGRLVDTLLGVRSPGELRSLLASLAGYSKQSVFRHA